MRVNLVGSALTTLALLPELRRHPSPRVVNVGSSSHLRAARVHAATAADERADADLSAYAESKLGLMQLSMLLRRSQPWLTVVDAHPGLVWTPMLQRHWGRLAPVLRASGLANVLFKTADVGATTLLAAALAPATPPAEWRERARWRRSFTKSTQPYFVNRRPGGFASAESRDERAAAQMWTELIEPLASVVLPEACSEMTSKVRAPSPGCT